jgi:hypothetical protein
MIYKDRMTFEEMCGVLKKRNYQPAARYAHAFPNTVMPLTPEEERELAIMVCDLASRIGKK